MLRQKKKKIQARILTLFTRKELVDEGKSGEITLLSNFRPVSQV